MKENRPGLSYKLRRFILKRDNFKCRQCGKDVSKIMNNKKEINEFTSKKELPIYKYYKKCWKCSSQTPISTYSFCLNYDYHIGDIKRLDQLLLNRIDSIQKVYSKTQEQDVIANVCTNCGSIQGNWFVMEDIIEMRSNNIEMKELIDFYVPNTLTEKDIDMQEWELITSSKKGHIHHIDYNPSNPKSSTSL